MRKQRKNNSSIGRTVYMLCLSLLFLNGPAGIHAEETEGFTPSGSPIIVLFADYTAGSGDNGDIAGFNLTRSRLGYQYQMTPQLSALSVLDVNVADDGQRSVNFHYAFFEWTWRDLRIDGGLIALSQFAVQEAFWGRRYIEKSFQDLNGFCFDSDLGVTLKYRFTDWIEADATLINGEGTRQINTSKMNRYGLGATLRPLKGLSLRAFLDFHESLDKNAPNQRTVSLFAGYRNSFFSVGAEYNSQKGKDFMKGADYSGISVYGGVPLGGRFDLYARYDNVKTSSGSAFDWQGAGINKDIFIAGIEYHPVVNFQISPNYRYIRPIGGGGLHFFGINAGFSI
jgi:hypothetical protein